MNKNVEWIFIAALVLLCQGCVIAPPAMPNDPAFAPVYPVAPALSASTDGSLYQQDFGMSLFRDRSAHRVGDILTVTLEERTTSSKSSGVSITKENDISFDDGTILSTSPSALSGQLGLETALSQSRDFAGDADADQSNQLSGNITVMVADVLPNGTLVVRGEKWITLNRGDEFIRISGMVRPDDISPDNTVTSTRLANARITYSGKGGLADAQEMGWLSRFFTSPYWPF